MKVTIEFDFYADRWKGYVAYYSKYFAEWIQTWANKTNLSLYNLGVKIDDEEAM